MIAADILMPHILSVLLYLVAIKADFLSKAVEVFINLNPLQYDRPGKQNGSFRVEAIRLFAVAKLA